MSTDQAVERAEALVSFQRYEEARELLARRVAEAPDDVTAWTELARCHHKSGSPQEGLAATGEALRQDPENVNALLLHGQLLVAGGVGIDKAVETLREAVRVRPQFWGCWSMLADYVLRQAIIHRARTNGQNDLTHEDVAAVAGEAVELAEEAIRLAPEEVRPYEVRRFIADLTGDDTALHEMDRAILRIDPTHSEALSSHTRKAVQAPGVRASEAADALADALGVTPDSAAMAADLDAATYRLLRGTRWLALLCLLFTAVGLDLWPDQAPRQLPLPLGQRLWDVLVLAAVWALGALLRYRKRRKGVRLTVRSLLRRDGWARLAFGQATAVTACSLVMVMVPWTGREIPRTVFWIVLVTTLLTMWVDRPQVRQAYRAGRGR
ncbi:tetratricopeptide repeat protein [Streptomyces sp. NPDC001922]|uniref:tetratricopeptide repeat protein n=1 Tax=Streptomyces sp. NPDC001922 TaxID=3364624 RepID=UPI0036B85B3F